MHLMLIQFLVLLEKPSELMNIGYWVEKIQIRFQNVFGSIVGTYVVCQIQTFRRPAPPPWLLMTESRQRRLPPRSVAADAARTLMFLRLLKMIIWQN